MRLASFQTKVLSFVKLCSSKLNGFFFQLGASSTSVPCQTDLVGLCELDALIPLSSFSSSSSAPPFLEIFEGQYVLRKKLSCGTILAVWHEGDFAHNFPLLDILFTQLRATFCFVTLIDKGKDAFPPHVTLLSCLTIEMWGLVSQIGAFVMSNSIDVHSCYMPQTLSVIMLMCLGEW